MNSKTRTLCRSNMDTTQSALSDGRYAKINSDR